MKNDITYKVWVEVEEVTEGDAGQDPSHRTLLDVNSNGHSSLEGALEAGISSLIAAKHQRAKEMQEMLRLMPLWQFPQEDSGVILCSGPILGSPQAHASGLSEAPSAYDAGTDAMIQAGAHPVPSSTYHPYEVGCCAVSMAEHEPEGRPVVDVQLPKFDATELDDIRSDHHVGIPSIPPEALGLVLANAEDVNRGGMPIEHIRHNCPKECADSGHTLNPHTIFKASGDAAAQHMLDAAQPGENRIVVVESADAQTAVDGSKPIRFGGAS